MSTLRTIGLVPLAGLAVWLAIAAAALLTDDPTLDLPTVLLVFGQLVIVPLGLSFLRFGGRPEQALVRLARVGFRFGAVAVIVSLALPRGELAAGVAAIYLVPAVLVGAASAVHGVRGLRGGWIWQPTRLAPTAAGAMLTVGALFFVLHRQGITVGGFPDHIIRLTAVHYHFTGFGLMLIAGSVARRARRTGTAGVYLLLAGMLITPIGFLVSPLVQVIGAVVVVSAIAAITVGTASALPLMRPAPRLILMASGGSMLVVAGLAAAYAIGEALGRPPVSVELMARVHGSLAAIGVVFCGLLGWRLAEDR